MEFTVKKYSELTTDELYELLKLRCAVFVVEQNCPYQDIDGKDKLAYHVFAKGEDGSIKACLRFFEKDSETAYMGRVITVDRGTGMGAKLLRAGISAVKENTDKKQIYLEAQSYAVGFYQKAGFAVIGEEFDEDGIPHKPMMCRL
ncbi:MAG: GNAT family N-acetyltransferase [Oscillospiraceae bacterium]|nr:GNAT family N-acetyltransferase [Oscillospiraceae bacterium]